MKNMIRQYIMLLAVSLSAVAMISCDSTLDVDAPADKLEVKTLYGDADGIRAAHTGLYANNFLSRNVYYSYIPMYLSMFSDDMKYRQTSYAEYYSNLYTENTSVIANMWIYLYQYVYNSNLFVENVEANAILPQDERDILVADALIFRAIAYFYLTNLYGDVPLVLDAYDRERNSNMPRTAQSEVYAQIERDLLDAAGKLGDTDRGVEYFSANACYALLSRVYAYTEQWDKAIETANKLIPVADGGRGTKYTLEEIAKVYKASSREAIFSANIEGYSGPGTHVGYTREGYNFVPSGNTVNYQLTENIVNLLAADTCDLRNQWIDSRKGVYFPNKYKNRDTPLNAEDNEYQNWFRLTESYLIRAEALAHKEDIQGAVDDVNTIRTRAGLDSLAADSMSQQDVLDAVMEERHKEFFCEMGHRFFDLRRTGKADKVLGACEWKQWKSHLQWLPVPLAEILNNNKLTQNEGYSY